MQFKNENELYSTIGKNIKFYREKAKLTQMKLAELSGISISYLTKIEALKCNKSISLAVLNNIANTLNIDIKKFLEKENCYD